MTHADIPLDAIEGAKRALEMVIEESGGHDTVRGWVERGELNLDQLLSHVVPTMCNAKGLNGERAKLLLSHPAVRQHLAGLLGLV